MNSDFATYQPSDDSIVVYKSNDGIVQLDVQVADETVWLTLNQLAMLFDRDKSVISRHLRNIYAEGELSREATVAKNATVQNESGRMVVRQIEYYNLDVIISIGYRVKSLRGTQFRQWANKVLKDYLLRGYSINQHLVYMEQRIDHQLQEHTEQIHELRDKVDFFVRTSLQPKEGVFYNGQIFDAYVFATDLIKSAKKSVILIDNYVDESVLLMLAKRDDGVTAKIVTRSISDTLQLDLGKHNKQYPSIDIQESDKYHDRFLIIDEEVYHLGASLKDLGKKLFAFSRMEMPAKTIIGEGNMEITHCDVR
ncbi:MAG: virulence RhuM family protein [Bacteroidales bacterium]|nr:virulence RhuM family protein [Bacteroidales bacterium]